VAPHPAEDHPDFRKRSLVLGLDYAEIVMRYGRSTAETMLRSLTYSPTKSHVKLAEKIELVERLLRMPGDRNQYKLAQLIVAENRKTTEGSTDLKTIQRQIGDAIAAIRRLQESEGDIAILEVSDDGDDDAVKTKYGVRYIT